MQLYTFLRLAHNLEVRSTRYREVMRQSKESIQLHRVDLTGRLCASRCKTPSATPWTEARPEVGAREGKW